MAEPPPQLDYAQRPALWRRRNVPRWVWIVLVLALLLPVALKFASRAIYAVRINGDFAQCGRRTPPPVAFTENSTERTSLRANPEFWVVNTSAGHFAYSVPHEWSVVLSATGVNQISQGTVYVDERRAAQLGSRLVGVDVIAIQRGGPLRVGLITRTLARGATLSLPRLDTTTVRWLTLSDVIGELRILSGKSDPNDASHFTISFTVGGAPGLIDGWLNDDGTTLLEVREIATTVPAPLAAPPASPATWRQ